MIRVLLADDHGVVRDGLARLLGSVPDIEVVAAAADGDQAIELAREHRPDVVLMDLRMPRMDGSEATRRLLEIEPTTQVVILTSFSERDEILSALDAGAIGYLLKDAEPDEIIRGVRAAAQGDSPLAPKAARTLIGSRGSGPTHQLTDREREVLQLVARGLPNKLIARELGISEKTVKAHLTTVFQRIGVTDRVQAADVGTRPPPRLVAELMAADTLSLLDWRRTISDLYAEVRATTDKPAAWSRWQATRARLFREHAQSPIPPKQRGDYTGPHLYEYDPEWCVSAVVEPVEARHYEIATSNVETMGFMRIALAHFTHSATELMLELYWLDGYGGGLFLPFADATSGRETYGAGRYVLDTVKGADLGHAHGRLMVDFNFAYQPSCAYDPRWTCPLAPPPNRLKVPVRAGERVAAG